MAINASYFPRISLPLSNKGVDLSTAIANLAKSGQLQNLILNAAPPAANVIDPGIIQKVATNTLLSGVADGSISPAQAVNMAGSPQFYASIERSMLLDPMTQIPRHFPVYLCGGVVSGGVLTFKPQRSCIPLRLLIPAAQVGTLQALQVGVTPLTVTASATSSQIFNETAMDSSWLAPIQMAPGQLATATVTSVTSAAMWVADTSDTRGALNPPSDIPMHAFFTASIPATSTATINVAPQSKMRLRRVAIDCTPAGVSACIVNNLLVQNKPQYESGDGVPITAFSQALQLGWMDGDVCETAANISLVITNPGGSAVTIAGTIFGDTV